MELVVSPGADIPAATPKPADPPKEDQPAASEKPADEGREAARGKQGGFDLLTGILIFTLLIALVAIGACIYVYRKQEIVDFLNRLFRKDSDD